MLVFGLARDDLPQNALHFVQLPQLFRKHGLVVKQFVVGRPGFGLFNQKFIGGPVLLVVPQQLHFSHQFHAGVGLGLFGQTTQQLAAFFELSLFGKYCGSATLGADHVVSVVYAVKPRFGLGKIPPLLGDLRQRQIGLHQASFYFCRAWGRKGCDQLNVALQ